MDPLKKKSRKLSGRYNFARLNVIVIEDNPHMRMLLKSIMHALGFQTVMEAGDAGEGFEMLKQFPADFAIVDWHMKPVDGLEFIRMVRRASDSPNPYLPIIMVTGHTELHRVIEARDAGANEMMAKPVSPGALYSRIISVIEHPRSFVRTDEFFGPDRRRRDLGPPAGAEERRGGEHDGDAQDVVEV